MSQRARVITTLILTLIAVVLTAISRRPQLGLLYCAALASVALLADLRGSRSLLVDFLYGRMGSRRPDLSRERLNGYVIGWCLIVIAGFAIVFAAVLGRV